MVISLYGYYKYKYRQDWEIIGWNKFAAYKHSGPFVLVSAHALWLRWMIVLGNVYI